ncbi:putative L-cysteine desulfhydrase 2, partial [Lamellibrachia satsuma]
MIRLLEEQEAAPDRWFRWRIADYWKDNIEAACRFVGAKSQNAAFVRNGTTAVNTVLKSLPLKAGDAILVYSWTYQSVRNACDATAQRAGAEVISVDIKIPIKSRHEVIEQYRVMLNAHTNVKIAVLELISCPTAAAMPILELVKLCQERGVLVLLDGAHGPGQVPLNLEELGQSGVDFFTGNFHKWVYAPRGCTILWVHPKHHKVIRPIVTSAYYNHDAWQEDFMIQGTADDTAYYSCMKAIELYQGIGGM